MVWKVSSAKFFSAIDIDIDIADIDFKAWLQLFLDLPSFTEFYRVWRLLLGGGQKLAPFGLESIHNDIYIYRLLVSIQGCGRFLRPRFYSGIDIDIVDIDF